jgi:hypothetical protein
VPKSLWLNCRLLAHAGRFSLGTRTHHTGTMPVWWSPPYRETTRRPAKPRHSCPQGSLRKYRGE